MSQIESRRETVYRSCPLCEAHCGIGIEVDRDAGQVVTIKGNDDDPMSRGYICPKAYGLKGLHEDPDRLRGPMRRTGSEWEEISWDEALDYTAARLMEIREAHGANAVGTYLGNPTVHNLGTVLYGPLLQRALGTRWRFSASSVDQWPKMFSAGEMFGETLFIPVPDIDRTDFFLVLGGNPVVSNGSLMTAPDMPGRLKALRERGGKLVVVDPRRSETAELADQHIFLKPGSDAFFLFALIHTLFEEDRVALGRLEAFTRGVDEIRTLAKEFAPERVSHVTGVPAETLRQLARDFSAAPRAVCYGRIGTCTQEFGTLANWLVDVLNTLTGNLDRAGGAMFPTPPPERARAGGPGRGIPYARWRSHVRGLPEFAGELPVASLAEEIDSAGEERIRALVTHAGNPVLSTPNGDRLERALESLDFMVSIDIYLNETTRFADIILPPVSHLECSNYDLAFNTFSVRNFAHYSPRVFEKPEGAKEGWEILLALTARLGGAAPEVVENLMISRFIDAAAESCPNADAEAIRGALGEEPGPERVLDAMLRAGPFGDQFDGDGLSLEQLRDNPHGIDLGPLEPRLPQRLATETGSIELAPARLVADVERLRSRQDAAREHGMVLIGRRHLRSNNSWMRNVRAIAKGPERCTLLVHPEDAARLGLRDGGSARVRSRVAELEAPVSVTDEIMPGVVSLPHGFGHGARGARLGVAAEFAGVNSNRLTDELGIDALSGNAILNGIPVAVSAA